MGRTVVLDTFKVLNALCWHISTPYTALIKQILDNNILDNYLQRNRLYLVLEA